MLKIKNIVKITKWSICKKKLNRKMLIQNYSNTKLSRINIHNYFNTNFTKYKIQQYKLVTI